ncbi:MAG: glycosyltransferase family 2 protein [Saprospiraceae bacterium]|nr:glycosyltransferase family 2 protein [Saprospiraceae bacterium]
MPRLSIVVTFRNRNLERVQRFLASIDHQSYRDFELIFVDYGSDAPFAEAVEAETGRYGWCTHVYNDTRGMLWNKSHAINTGMRLAQGEYVLSTDIDLIYTRDVLNNAMQHADPGRQLFSLAFMLPETFSDYTSLEASRPQHFEESPYQSIGMFHLLSNEVFRDKLGGLDEFYCIWGREDTDGYVRGRNAGLESYWMDNRAHPLYHQWHPTYTASHPRFMKLWWEDLVIYFETKRNEVHRGQEDWGRLYSTEMRRSIQDTPYTSMRLPRAMNPFERSRAMADIIHFLKQESSKVVEVVIPKEKTTLLLKGRKPVHRIGFFGVRAFNVLMEKSGLDLEMRSQSSADVMTSEESMLYFIFNLIVKQRMVTEYHYSEEEDRHVYKLCALS